MAAELPALREEEGEESWEEEWEEEEEEEEEAGEEKLCAAAPATAGLCCCPAERCSAESAEAALCSCSHSCTGCAAMPAVSSALWLLPVLLLLQLLPART